MNEAPSVSVTQVPRVWPVFAVLLGALAATLFGGCFSVLFFIQPGLDPSQIKELLRTPSYLLAALAASQFAMLLALRFVPKWVNDVPAGLLERVAWRGDLRPSHLLVLWLGALAAGALVLTLFAEAGQSNTGTLALFKEGARAMTDTQFAFMLLFGALAPGVIEEMLFRGFVQTRLVERYGPAAGIASAALLFGLWHFDLRQGAAAVVLGAWFGVWSHRLKTIVPVVFAHALNNAVGFALSRFGLQDATDSTPLASKLALEFAVLAACAGAMWWLTQRPTQVNAPRS